MCSFNTRYQHFLIIYRKHKVFWVFSPLNSVEELYVCTFHSDQIVDFALWGQNKENQAKPRDGSTQSIFLSYTFLPIISLGLFIFCSWDTHSINATYSFSIKNNWAISQPTKKKQKHQNPSGISPKWPERGGGACTNDCGTEATLPFRRDNTRQYGKTVYFP
jgi:hypothetical protein